MRKNQKNCVGIFHYEVIAKLMGDLKDNGKYGIVVAEAYCSKTNDIDT